MENKEALLDYLVTLFVDSVTSVFSDDSNAMRRDQARFQSELEKQTVYTKYDVQLEASKRVSFIAAP